MNSQAKFAMLSARRLTSQGRLAEAMSVIRGALGAVEQPAAGDEKSGHHGGLLIDMIGRATASGKLWTSPPADGETLPSSPATKHVFGPVERLRRFGDAGEIGGKLIYGRAVVNPIPEGASFAEHRFANGARHLTYKLYVPRRDHDDALPLIVMLHGCTQSPDDFAAGTRMNELAEELKFLVAYPAQTHSANMSKCWNWFKEEDQQRDRGEPSLIAGITREIIRDHTIDPGRVYVAGLSAGGAAAAILGMTYPDIYAAIGVHSGLACGAATDMTSAFAAMRGGAGRATTLPKGVDGSIVPTIVFHCGGDRTVNPINGDQVIAQSQNAMHFDTTSTNGKTAAGVSYVQTVKTDESGRSVLEQWLLNDVGHAWSGGSAAGSFTEPRGPDASREMVRFFLQHDGSARGDLAGAQHRPWHQTI